MTSSRSELDLEPEMEPIMKKGFTLALQLLGRREDAADVLQEALRKLLQGKRLDRRPGKRQAWFLKVVRNGALALIRQRKVQDGELVTQLVDDARTPDVAAERNELSRIARSQIEAMPIEQRELILLRDFHEFSNAEIAKMLDLPEGTVRSRLSRAHKELRHRMREYLQ